jgi:hypothetical protein
MTDKQKESLIDLTKQYISNMDDGHAKVKIEDIRKHLNNTLFCWVGKTNEEAVFYYRIHKSCNIIRVRSPAAGGSKNSGSWPNAKSHSHNGPDPEWK